MIPYGRQSIDEADIEAVVEVLRSDLITQGPKVPEFESALCEHTGARFAVAFSSGTAALHAAANAAGLGPGDRVVTSPLSFVASANAGRYVGAEVGFVDIDADTLNIDPRLVPADIDGLVAVHFAGLPMDLRALAHRPRVVIEDAAHAIGAATPDGPVGNCAHSDMCCFSFHPVKTLTTGEGGAVTTNSEQLAERLRRFRHHGISPAPGLAAWAYDVVEAGYNFRLTDLQAALGLSQLAKLETFVDRRNAIADDYRNRLADVDGLVVPSPAPDGVRHAYHLFVVQVPDRDRVYKQLRDAGIGVQVHYRPIHHLSLYRGGDWDLPVVDDLGERILSLPVFPALGADQQDAVVVALLEALERTSAT